MLVITFLPSSKCLLISWLQSSSAVIFGAQENQICHCFIVSTSISHEVIGLDAMIFVFWMLSFKPVFLLFSFTFLVAFLTSLVVQVVKNLPAMWKIWVWSLGWEDPLEKGTVTHSSILTWKIPWTEEPGRLQSLRLQRVKHDWATLTSLHFFHFHQEAL